MYQQRPPQTRVIYRPSPVNQKRPLQYYPRSPANDKAFSKLAADFIQRKRSLPPSVKPKLSQKDKNFIKATDDFMKYAKQRNAKKQHLLSRPKEKIE
jgi:hypothetical protein